LVEPDGTRVELESIPRRVVVLSVNTAGVLASLGIMPVAMSTTARAHHILRDVPQIAGRPAAPNIEQLLMARPDLVIANNAFKSTLAPIFATHGIAAYFIENQRYSDVIDNIEMFGRAFNRESNAQALIQHIRERERAAVARTQGRPEPRVLVIFGTAQAFMMSTQYGYVGGMVTMLNGKNLTETLNIPRGAQNIPISMEEVVRFNPQIILRISHGTPEEMQRIFAAEFANNPLWRGIDAVQNGRVHDLPSTLFFSNPGLTMIDALEHLAAIVHP